MEHWRCGICIKNNGLTDQTELDKQEESFIRHLLEKHGLEVVQKSEPEHAEQ